MHELTLEGAAERIAFADESGVEPKTNCYAIGMVSLDSDKLEAFEQTFFDWKIQHGVQHELKWKSVSKGHGTINLALSWLDALLRSNTASFDAIVVNTAQYQNWRKLDWEAAFYQTYTYLLQHVGSRAPVTDVFIDDRSDSYGKRVEVVEKIANAMLALKQKGRVQNVSKASSHLTPGIQVADLLTGAIAMSHRRFLKPDLQVNRGKLLAEKRMAAILGWDALHYDTLPNDRFNVWHFPTEYRATPRTRKVAHTRPTFVEAAELRRWIGGDA